MQTCAILKSPLSKPFWVLLVVTVLTRVATAADGEAQQQFNEGYFQQVHEHNYAAAAAAYEKVLANQSASEAIRAEAKTRLAQCREDQAAADLAQLMPASAVVYFEINRPGKHIARILEMLGLVRSSRSTETANTPVATRLPGGLAVPGNVSISPALVRELEKVRGAAVAITGIEPNGKPTGDAIIHPGEFDLPRGLIESGLQVLPPGEPIAGFKVYQFEGQVWIAATQRLFIVSDSREQIAQAVARMQAQQTDSLAKEPQFSRLTSDRENALAFLYVNGRRAVEVAGPHLRGQEAMMARMFLDLEHLESVSASLGTSDKGVHAQAKMVLAEGHRNLAYGMVRTAPLTRRSLAHVPAGAAAVAVLGLNPAALSPEQSGAQPPSLTAMDIGREVFANVEEISLFVLPAERGDSARAIPEIGVIAAVKDPAKSQALWDQLLSLAAMFGPQVAQPPREIEIEGRKGKEYQFQGAPPIVVVRVGDRAMAAGTKGAVSAAIRAEGPYAITGDPQFKPLLDGLRPESSKAVLVHPGRVIGIAAATMPRERDQARQIAALVGDLRIMVVTNEQPNELSIRAAAWGLPDVNDIIQAAIAAHAPPRNASVRSPSEPPRPEERTAPPQRNSRPLPAPQKSE
jgi:hypothetical protein